MSSYEKKEHLSKGGITLYFTDDDYGDYISISENGDVLFRRKDIVFGFNTDNEYKGSEKLHRSIAGYLADSVSVDGSLPTATGREEDNEEKQSSENKERI